MNKAWDKVIERLESEECREMHKIYSRDMGFAFLTDRKGIRHKLESWYSPKRIDEIIDLVKRVNAKR
jgi:hypothetical protein